jgi:hypothetical protein
MTGRVGDWRLFLLRRCNHFHLQSEDAITDASATLSETLEFEGRNAPAFDFLDNVSVTGAGVPDGG